MTNQTEIKATISNICGRRAESDDQARRTFWSQNCVSGVESPETPPEWLKRPLQIFTWLDMQEFASENLYAAALQMEQFKTGLTRFINYKEPLLSTESRKSLAKELTPLARYLQHLGLKQCVSAVNRLKDELLEQQLEFSIQDVVARTNELHRSIHDGLKSYVFMSFSPGKQEWWENPTRDWEEVIKRWSEVRNDIEESSKCFACERYAAAIFHILLVAEFGVIQLARLLGDQDPKAGWGMLDRLERIRQKPYPQRSSLEQQHSPLLESSLPLMLAVKDSWRHKITHVDNKLSWLDTDFSHHVAEEIIKATRGLMRRLSADLP